MVDSDSYVITRLVTNGGLPIYLSISVINDH